MSDAGVLLRNARIVDPASGRDEAGWVHVAHGVIEASGAGLPPHIDAIHVDADGAVLAPALIDLSVETHPSLSDLETVETAAAAAATGGVGSFVARPAGGAYFDTPGSISSVAGRGAGVRTLPAAAATHSLAGERLTSLRSLRDAGAVLATTGAQPIADARTTRSAFQNAADVDIVLALRPQDPSLTAGGVAHESAFTDRLGLKGVPALAEELQIERDARLASDAGARVLFDQLSAGQGVNAVARAKDRTAGVAATVSTAHLSFNEIDVGDFDSRYRLDPPLRAEEDRLALIEGLRSGVIDAIVSAHAGCSTEDKRAPFGDALPGGAGLETLLAAALSLSRDYGFSLLDTLAPLTCRPADVLGLPQGRLAIGAPADLIVFDPDAPWRCRGADLRGRTKVTPFDGRLLQGRVRLTMVRGKIIFDAAETTPV